MDSIIVLVLKIAMIVIPYFIKDSTKKAEWIKKIKEQTDKYNKGVEDSAKVKQAHDDLKAKADEEWKKRFGS